MSSVHCIVVWEWECAGAWLPHTPGVSRALERAHAKQLTRVVLADADPALKGYYVNLRTLTQYSDVSDETESATRVRRACYSVASVGGRGARWEWAPHGGTEPLPMEIQCRVEESCQSGGGIVPYAGWRLCGAQGVARGAGGRVRVRRVPQPPYPLARAAPPPPPPGPRLPPAPLAPTPPPPPAPPRPPSPRTCSPPRRNNLARQILHNLNIFSTNSREPGRDSASSDQRRARRHSVDTVSTYLSHESKESDQTASVCELLNCSGGSDDVFEAPTTEQEQSIESLGAVSAWLRTECVLGWGGACELQEAYVPCDDCSPPSQPPGSMAWSAHHNALRVVYSFQSGIQGPNHPCPGAPYYAVGFPRHSLLPDTPLGRQVLSALRLAWSRRLLFCVRRSRTTGREYVVTWSVPGDALHTRPPAVPPPAALAPLLHALHALTAARPDESATLRNHTNHVYTSSC